MSVDGELVGAIGRGLVVLLGVGSGDTEDDAAYLAEKIANGPPIAIRLMKFQAYEGLHMDLDTALQIAAACETITLSSEDHKEGLAAFREKRPPNYQGK